MNGNLYQPLTADSSSKFEKMSEHDDSRFTSDPPPAQDLPIHSNGFSKRSLADLEQSISSSKSKTESIDEDELFLEEDSDSEISEERSRSPGLFESDPRSTRQSAPKRSPRELRTKKPSRLFLFNNSKGKESKHSEVAKQKSSFPTTRRRRILPTSCSSDEEGSQTARPEKVTHSTCNLGHTSLTENITIILSSSEEDFEQESKKIKLEVDELEQNSYMETLSSSMAPRPTKMPQMRKQFTMRDLSCSLPANSKKGSIDEVVGEYLKLPLPDYEVIGCEKGVLLRRLIDDSYVLKLDSYDGALIERTMASCGFAESDERYLFVNLDGLSELKTRGTQSKAERLKNFAKEAKIKVLITSEAKCPSNTLNKCDLGSQKTSTIQSKENSKSGGAAISYPTNLQIDDANLQPQQYHEDHFFDSASVGLKSEVFGELFVTSDYFNSGAFNKFGTKLSGQMMQMGKNNWLQKAKPKQAVHKLTGQHTYHKPKQSEVFICAQRYDNLLTALYFQFNINKTLLNFGCKAGNYLYLESCFCIKSFCVELGIQDAASYPTDSPTYILAMQAVTSGQPKKCSTPQQLIDQTAVQQVYQTFKDQRVTFQDLFEELKMCPNVTSSNILPCICEVFAISLNNDPKFLQRQSTKKTAEAALADRFKRKCLDAKKQTLTPQAVTPKGSISTKTDGTRVLKINKQYKKLCQFPSAIPCMTAVVKDLRCRLHLKLGG